MLTPIYDIPSFNPYCRYPRQGPFHDLHIFSPVFPPQPITNLHFVAIAMQRWSPVSVISSAMPQCKVKLADVASYVYILSSAYILH